MVGEFMKIGVGLKWRNEEKRSNSEGEGDSLATVFIIKGS
jgi:hypothetical protein